MKFLSSPVIFAATRSTALPVSSKLDVLSALMSSFPAVISFVPLACTTAPAAARSLTVPSAPRTPTPSPAPPRAATVPATVSVLPAVVRVMLPAAPPLVPDEAVASVPDVTMPPTLRLPSAAVPVVLRMTAPPAVPLLVLRVSMVWPLESILGAVSVMLAPPVVIPVGFTAPILKPSLLEKFTAPVASDAKVLTSLSGMPELVALRVNVPTPDRPSLSAMIAPDWVTALPAANTMLPAVSILLITNVSLSVKRLMVAAPTLAVSAALRTLSTSVLTSLPAAVSTMAAPLLFSDLTVSVSATTAPVPKVMSVEIAPFAVRLAAPDVSIWLTATSSASP